MKTLLRLLLLALLGLIAAACASPASTPTAAPISEESLPAEARQDGLHPQPDLSRVANSGRPQFLTSYANW